jgi:hypothetical protein
VVCNSERLNKCANLGGEVTQGVNETLFCNTELSETTGLTGETEECSLGADVVTTVLAELTLVTHEVRLYRNLVANLDLGDAFANFSDNTSDLVTENDRQCNAGEGVRVTRCWAEHGAIVVFVKVGSTDTGPFVADLDVTSLDLRLVDLLGADVVLTVVTGSFHCVHLL